MNAAEKVTLPYPDSRGAELRPLFIVNMWRAGSSVLYLLLNKHPQIALLYEADLMGLQPFFWLRNRGTAWAKRWEFWNQSLSRHGIPFESIPAGLRNAHTAARAVYGDFARRKGATIWGDKTPNFYDRLLSLARDFPDARFIILWRDPRGTARSMVRAASAGGTFFRKRGIHLRAILGYGKLKEQCDALVALGVPVLQLSYEDLVGNGNAVLPEICRFLEVPFRREILTPEGADRSALFAGDHHRLLHEDFICTVQDPVGPLPPGLESKIERYLAMWRGKYAGAWPPYPRSLGANAAKPGSIERAADRVMFRFFCLFDFVILVIFSFAPIRLLRHHRARRMAKGSPEPLPTGAFSLDSSRNTFPPGGLDERGGAS